MKIYTKTGDDGTTSLRSGERVSKTDSRIEAFGAIDELNSFLGMIDLPQTRKAQRDLMKILAQKKVGCKWLEKEIDRMQNKLPELHKFVIPVGTLHFARAVCRRAERRIVAIRDSGAAQNDTIKYLNRLSDYLFVLALDEQINK